MPEPDLTLIREFQRRAEEALPGRIVRVMLYGSRARGGARPDSAWYVAVSRGQVDVIDRDLDLGVGLGDGRGRRRDSLGFGRVRLGFFGILGHGVLRGQVRSATMPLPASLRLSSVASPTMWNFLASPVCASDSFFH
jgi:hypothetical protein